MQPWLSRYCTTNSLSNYMGTKPNHADWNKLCRMMQLLKQTVKDKLILRADSSGHLS